MSLHRRNAKRDASEPAIVEYLRHRGALVERISGAGIPDLLVGWCGRWILLECKTGKGDLTPVQQDFHQSATRKGLPVYTVNSVERTDEILDRILRLAR